MSSINGTVVEKCDVEGCNNDADRSLNMKLVSKSSLKIGADANAHSIHLCKEHYRQYKKDTKTSRSLDSVY